MKELKDIFADIINNEKIKEKLENTSDLKELYKIFRENGYEKSYEDFENDIMNLYLKTEISDYELDQISGGKNQRVNRILAGMFSALTISNPILNISATNLENQHQKAYSLKKDTSTTENDKSLFEKIKLLLTSDTVKNVAIGGAAVGTPLLASVFIVGGYKYFTSLKYKFSQVIDYCLKNKDFRQSPAEEKYVEILKDIINQTEKNMVSLQQNSASDTSEDKMAELNQSLAKIRSWLEELGDNTSQPIAIERLGEIVADNEFLPMLRYFEIDSLPEFETEFHKEKNSDRQSALLVAQQQLATTAEELENKNNEIRQKQQQIDRLEEELLQKDQQLDARNQVITTIQKQFEKKGSSSQAQQSHIRFLRSRDLIRASLQKFDNLYPYAVNDNPLNPIPKDIAAKECDGLKQKIISSFIKDFIPCNTREGKITHEKCLITVAWLLDKQPETVRTSDANFNNSIESLLNNLPYETFSACVHYVFDPTDDQRKRAPFIDSGMSQEDWAKLSDEERRAACENYQLMEDFIKTITRINKQEWESTDIFVDARPSQIIEYYKKVAVQIDNALKDPRYAPLTKPFGMDSTQHAVALAYLRTICENVRDILPDNNNKKKELTRLIGQTNAIFESKKDEPLPNSESTIALFEKVCECIKNVEVSSSLIDTLKKGEQNLEQAIVNSRERDDALKKVQMSCRYSYDSYATEETRPRYANEWFGDISKGTYKKGEEPWAGFIHYDEKNNAIVVAYHGTDSWADVLTDAAAFHAESENFNGATVHRGFLNRYMQTSDEMKSELENKIETISPEKQERLKIVVTGHSLGGALATLAALDLVQDSKFSNYKDKIDLVTFCSPRVLSQNAWEEIQKKGKEDTTYALLDRSIRIWRKGDPVPAVPTGWMEYKHFGKSWRINNFYLNPHSIGNMQNDINYVVAKHGDSDTLTVINEAYVSPTSSPKLKT